MQSAAELAADLLAVADAVTEAAPGALEAAVYEYKEAHQVLIAREVGADMAFSNAGSVNVQYRMNGRGVRTSATIRPAGAIHFLERGTRPHTIPGFVRFGDVVGMDVQHPGTSPRPVWERGRAMGAAPAQTKFEEAIDEAVTALR